MDVSLVMFKADGTRRDFPLTKRLTVLGRTNSCDLRIALSSVSRKHCELKIDGDTIRVKDLGSSNGTLHNGNRVQEGELEAGDELAIGPVRFTVVVDGKPEQIKPVRTVIGEDAEEGSSAEASAVAAELAADQSGAELSGVALNAGSGTLDLDDDALSDSSQDSDSGSLDLDSDESGELPLALDDDDDKTA